MAPPTSVLSTTLQLLRDKLVDNSYLAHPLFRAIEQSGNLVRVSGGSRVEQPVIFGEHSSLTELTNGFEPVSMAVTDPFNVAKYEYSNFTQPIILSAVEELANKGETAVVNILEAKMNNVMLGLRKAVSERVFVGGSTLSTLQTLNGMGTATVAAETTGWFEAGAPGAQTNTVGGLSKTTFRSENWFNQVQDAGGTLSLEDLDELFINCQIRNPAGTFPDLLFMSPKCFAAFQALQQSSVNYVSASDRDSLDRDMVAMWRGAKIFVEPNLGYNNAAGNAVSAYALSSSQFQLYADNDAFFTVSDMLPVPGTATKAAQVISRIQLCTGHLASHGVLLRAES
tara:strand:- start:321 stop:1340 length:1020 start_codon:yes stop_codon:yes gene_type:complete